MVKNIKKVGKWKIDEILNKIDILRKYYIYVL